MVKLFTLLLIAISFSGFGQVYQTFNAYGWEVNRIKINGGLTLPTYAGLPSIGTVSNSSVNLRGALIYNTNDSTIYGWSGTQWRAIGSGGGGGTWGSITGTLSSQTDLQTALNAKQATLVSSTNIKTLGGQSLLGSGDFGVNAPLEIVGGSGVSLGITQAGSSGDGYLSSTDWNTFNNKKNADDSTTANPANYVTQYQRNKLRDSLAGLIGLSGYYYADGTFNTDRNVAGANKRLTYTDLRHLVVEANEKITLTASTVGLMANDSLKINIGPSLPTAGQVLTTSATGRATWQTPSGGGGLTGLTTGGILFGGSLGNAVQNSSKLYIDSINNFVGIGTNTPGATLHIKPKSSSLTPVIIDSLGTYTNTGYAKLAGVPGNGLFKTSTGVLMIRPEKPAMATIDTLVYDDFNRATLGSNYDTTGSGFTTVLSGGKLTLSTSTSNTNTDRFLRYKGYGYSTMRSFKTTIWYRQPTARASSTYGAVVGAYSMRNPGQKCTSVGVTDFSTNFGPGLNHFALTSTGSANIVTSSTSGIPAMSTTNLYRLDFEVKKDSAYTTLTNVTAGTSKVLSYKYDFTSTSQDATKPNFFYYALGINNGGTNATTLVIDSFLVTTTEKKNVDIVFVGNSITTGYYGGTADSAFAEKLKTNTTKTIQILAGGYNQSVDAVLNLPEILYQNPDTAFFCLGTNDISGSVPTATTMAYLATIYTSCVNNGTFPVFFTVPNGGNTVSGGGLNQSIAAAYPSNYVDLWTLFFNAYPGEMVDSVHPNAAGMRRIQGIIKAAYPSLFPL